MNYQEGNMTTETNQTYTHWTQRPGAKAKLSAVIKKSWRKRRAKATRAKNKAVVTVTAEPSAVITKELQKTLNVSRADYAAFMDLLPPGVTQRQGFALILKAFKDSGKKIRAVFSVNLE